MNHITYRLSHLLFDHLPRQFFSPKLPPDMLPSPKLFQRGIWFPVFLFVRHVFVSFVFYFFSSLFFHAENLGDWKGVLAQSAFIQSEKTWHARRVGERKGEEPWVDERILEKRRLRERRGEDRRGQERRREGRRGEEERRGEGRRGRD